MKQPTLTQLSQMIRNETDPVSKYLLEETLEQMIARYMQLNIHETNEQTKK